VCTNGKKKSRKKQTKEGPFPRVVGGKDHELGRSQQRVFKKKGKGCIHQKKGGANSGFRKQVEEGVRRKRRQTGTRKKPSAQRGKYLLSKGKSRKKEKKDLSQGGRGGRSHVEGLKEKTSPPRARPRRDLSDTGKGGGEMVQGGGSF